MLIASLFLLWVAVILLGVAVVTQARQLRQLHDRLNPAPLAGTAPLTGTAPVASAPTLAGDMLTIGGPSADGRAWLLLFIRAGCAASRTAIRDALALTDRKRLRLLFLGEGRAEDYRDLLRQHRIRDTDMIVSAQLLRDFQATDLPAAALIDARGRLLGRGAIAARAQLDALLARLPPAEGEATPGAGQGDADRHLMQA
ncbi:MAG: methylamine utilization protein MauD [Pseudomonadota bacterium]|uniref:methylamine utilization protein MauD n=1 Tax=Sphingobium sp. TaxID=1912891 RepID=UPI002E2392DA